MLRTPVRQILSAVAVALLLTACVPAESRPERQSLDDLVAEVEAANADADGDGHDHADHDHGEETEGDGDGSVEQTDGETGEPTSEPTSATEAGSTDEAPSEPPAAQTSDEPEGPVMEQHDDFDITVTLSATCVEQGGEMTILVEAGRNNGVAYLAYYAGGESGAPPPWGEDHGGNNGDLTDDDGRYEDTWVVSPSAPVGPARVEVLVNRNNGEPQKSTAVERFEVVEAGSGGCGR